MLNITKQLMEQDYRPVTEIKKGDRIYLNYRKKNGVLTVTHIETAKNSVNSIWGIRRTISYLNIFTNKYEFKFNDSWEIPKVSDGWIIRAVPNSGQYYLMNGYRVDNKSKNTIGISIKLIDKEAKVEPFIDRFKFYSDSKTKDYLTSKKTSKYSREHSLEYYNSRTREHYTKIKKIEFEYDKDNFLIPYRFNNMVGTITIPDDVRVIGTRCFANFRFLDRVILPDHKVKFKKGALINCNFLPEVDPVFNVKLDEFTMNGGRLLKGYSKSYNVRKYHEGEISRSLRMEHYLSYDYVNPDNLKIGMELKFPVLVNKIIGNNNKVVTKRIKTVLLDIKNNIYVFDIGNYKIDELSKSFIRVEFG